MKRFVKYVFMMLALSLAGTSCLRELSPAIPGGGSGLSVRPSIFRASENTLVTKGKEDTDSGIVKDDQVNARDELRENFFGSLDIFVKRQADAPGTAWFKEYHLNAGDTGVIIDPSKYDNESLLDQAKQALASNWAEQGFEPGVPYDIYVTANNPHTAASTAPSNLTALQALTTNTTDIYRYYLTYTPSQEDRIYWTNCMYSEKKNFLMDGKIEGWTIDPSKAEQVFDVDLKRAAAKILLTVNFSDEKTIPMIPEKLNPGDPDPTPVTDASGHVVMGSVKEYMQLVGRTVGEPRIKPVNFNLNCSDVAYDADPLPGSGSLLTIDSNFSIFKEGSSTDNTENTFAAVTYTYPIDWSSDNSCTPYILLSVFFTRDSDGDQLRSYYRIPVCDESQVSSLERNNIYIIDVKIASLGASNESFDAKDEELRIEYHVIPWTETNMTQEATTVKISDTKYLTIIPTEYTLKGDDEQSVDLQWFASVSVDDGRIVDIDPNSLHVSYVNYQSATVDIRGTVTKQVRNDGGTLVTATDANTDGRRDIVITSTAPNGSTAKGEKVVVTLTPNGIIQVKSDALQSRAIKDIEFTVYLKNASGVDAVPIRIRHFPLDNIQSFTGAWSSKWDESYTSVAAREYSFNPAADGWTSWDGYEDNINCTLSEYNHASEGKSSATTTEPIGTPSDYDSASATESGGNNSTVQTAFRSAVPQGTSRQNANSENNAYKDANSDYWYWGQTQTTNNASNASYDWSTGGWNRTYYRWTTYYRRIYYKTVTTYKARRYYRDVTKNVPTTGNWVDWENHTGNTNYDGTGFYAKVYMDGFANRIETNATSYTAQNFTNLTNRQMYVIQLTSTSSEYAIGRPVLDSNYQSNDNVCSPAFMIASQLGATSSNVYTATTAARHCGTYMEVGTDGKRYVGWRLPTEAEINAIIKYQTEGAASYSVTMVRVLAGRYYWALNGQTPTAYASGNNGTFVRCVRDLTLEEVEQLNNRTSF